jgi:hypothetical protein
VTKYAGNLVQNEAYAEGNWETDPEGYRRLFENSRRSLGPVRAVSLSRARGELKRYSHSSVITGITFLSLFSQAFYNIYRTGMDDAPDEALRAV